MAMRCLRALPLSACRPVLCAADMLATDRFGSIFPTTPSPLSRRLSAAIMVRRSPQAAADRLRKMADAVEAQATTPFASDSTHGSSASKNGGNQQAASEAAVSSMQNAAAELLQQLMKPNSKFNSSTVIRLLSSAGSPAPQPRQYQPALSSNC